MSETGAASVGLRARARVLAVGVGGLGCPSLLVLGHAGVGTLGLVDDDRVERTNLHRQILFSDADVGSDKVDAAMRGLGRLGVRASFEPLRTRLVPENAVELVSRFDVVLEGADNFATKFLVADACRIAGRPVVHAAAVRAMGTVLAVSPRGRPCYRCLFEDVPREEVASCDVAGALGPVVGWVAAVQADLALGVVDGRPRYGELVAIEAGDTRAAPSLRRRRLSARRTCGLCGESARPIIDAGAYLPGACDG